MTEVDLEALCNTLSDKCYSSNLQKRTCATALLQILRLGFASHPVGYAVAGPTCLVKLARTRLSQSREDITLLTRPLSTVSAMASFTANGLLGSVPSFQTEQNGLTEPDSNDLIDRVIDAVGINGEKYILVAVCV